MVVWEKQAGAPSIHDPGWKWLQTNGAQGESTGDLPDGAHATAGMR